MTTVADPPPVLLAHGIASTHEHTWEATGWTDVLTDAGRVVVPFELPGHGASPAPVDADDVGALLAVARAHGPVDAAGHSAGARLLLRAAVREPAAFRRIALLGVGDAVLRPAGGSSAALADVLERETEPAEPSDRLFWRLSAATGNDRHAVAAYLRRRPAPLTTAELGRVTPPVLLVLGERDFAAPADALSAALPSARLESVRGADHFGLVGDVRAIDVVTRFLDGSDRTA